MNVTIAAAPLNLLPARAQDTDNVIRKRAPPEVHSPLAPSQRTRAVGTAKQCGQVVRIAAHMRHQRVERGEPGVVAARQLRGICIQLRPLDLDVVEVLVKRRRPCIQQAVFLEKGREAFVHLRAKTTGLELPEVYPRSGWSKSSLHMRWHFCDKSREKAIKVGV
jgi:hypothetical protein